MKTILVTGGNGVLGSAFKAIEDDWPGYEFVYPTSDEMDLLTVTSTEDGLLWYQADYIIHCAALSGGVGISAKHPATLLRDNVLMSINILEAVRICGIEKTIMTLSSGMYPISRIGFPMDESYIHKGPPHDSNYAYAHAKRLIDPLIRSYREEFNMNIIGLVPNGIFGENDYFGLEDCNMTAALIRKFYAARDTDEDIVLWGDGTPLRELTYAKDLARAYMWALENYDDGQILNVGNTQEYSIAFIAERIAFMTNVDWNRVKWDTTKPSGPYRKPTDNSRSLGLSDFQYTDVRDALAWTVRWYHDTMQTNPDSIRTENKVRV